MYISHRFMLMAFISFNFSICQFIPDILFLLGISLLEFYSWYNSH